MNKKLKAAFAFLTLASLASCTDTSELYGGAQYIGGDFLKNHYSTWDKGLKEASIERHVAIENERTGYFNGKETKDPNSPEDYYGLGQAAAWHPNDFKNSKGEIYNWAPDILPGTGIGEWRDQSALYDVAYGQTKKLSLINPAFSRGYLSKLYNGQVRCNAWSSYSLVELDKTGYGTIFPSELLNANSFSFAIRGGSDTPSVGRVSTFNLHVTFYKYGADRTSYVGTTIDMMNVKMQTNRSAEITSLIGFYFEDINYDPKGVVGMSMTFDLVEDVYRNGDVTIYPSDDFSDDNEYHIGLILLEVFFPDSTWN